MPILNAIVWMYEVTLEINVLFRTFFKLNVHKISLCCWRLLGLLSPCPGEESLTIFVDKRKLSKRSEGSDPSTNSSAVTLETLHQLAASYFIDRESTLRRLHHIQIATAAIKVGEGVRRGQRRDTAAPGLTSGPSLPARPKNSITRRGESRES